MSSPEKVMIVDDEPNIVEVTRLYLEHAGFTPVIHYSGSPVIESLQTEQPVLLILDVMLPDISGFDLCQTIRGLTGMAGKVPIILLTAKGESMDKLRGFNLGVDDYIVKPFDPNELIARVKAVIRRTNAPGTDYEKNVEASEQRKRMLEFGSLTIDLDQYKVCVDGRRIELTPKEIELLYFLAVNPGRVYTREDLLMQVWNFDFIGGTRTVDAHVKNLRKKLGSRPDWTIQTLWGIGYSFEVEHHA